MALKTHQTQIPSLKLTCAKAQKNKIQATNLNLEIII